MPASVACSSRRSPAPRATIRSCAPSARCHCPSAMLRSLSARSAATWSWSRASRRSSRAAASPGRPVRRKSSAAASTRSGCSSSRSASRWWISAPLASPRASPKSKASTAPARNAPTTSTASGTSQPQSATATRTRAVFSEARYATAAPKASASRTPKRTDTAGRPRGRYPGGRALFFFDEALTVDAVAGEGQRFEALVGDGFPASLAVAEVASVDLLQGGDDFLQDPAVAIAQLEEELAVVGRGGLIAEVLRGIVLGPLAVQHVLAHFFDELAVFLLQLFLELGQSVLLHRCLLRDTAGPGPELVAKATTPPGGNQSRAAAPCSTERSGASPHRRSSA